MNVSILRLAHAHDLPLPGYATAGAAGLDLMAAIEDETELRPGMRMAIPCGIALAVPEGFEAQVRPRSGMALRDGVTVLNTPGTIDSDYRGEVKAILINLGDAPFRLTRGARIAQLVIAPVSRVVLVECAELPASPRGARGFGSTGYSATSSD